MKSLAKHKSTAGLRGSGWSQERMDKAFFTKPHVVHAADGQRILGLLYSRTGDEKAVVCTMHPREFSGTPYVVPDVLDAGHACWVQAPRSIGNDLRLEHEVALLDVAACTSYLRDTLGFRTVHMLGISGGAGLYGFYVQQASRDPANRLARTPGGKPVGLREIDMPVPDTLVLISPHPGQGVLLMNGIDPSVTDERDPFATEPGLDPFSRANGFVPPPQSSAYAPDFVARYRAAQRARVQRIDDWARDALHARAALRSRIKSEGRNALSELDLKKNAHAPIMEIWRTDADLRCWDLSIDPSDREVGSVWGRDPFASNWGSVGFARLVTPASWLSTWSGISSNASFGKFGAEVRVPTLMLEYTGDQAAFPSDMQAIFDSIGSARKVRLKVRGNHHGHALREGEEAGQVVAGRHLQAWFNER